MLSAPGASQRPQRLSIHTNPLTPLSDLYIDARLQGYQGPTRTVRLAGAAASGGGPIAKSEDGVRCVVAGKECVFTTFDGLVCATFSSDHIHP
jgi:hypothetical protein